MRPLRVLQKGTRFGRMRSTLSGRYCGSCARAQLLRTYKKKPTNGDRIPLCVLDPLPRALAILN